MPEDGGERLHRLPSPVPSHRSVSVVVALVVFAGLALSVSEGRVDVSAFLLYAGVPSIHRISLNRQPHR